MVRTEGRAVRKEGREERKERRKGGKEGRLSIVYYFGDSEPWKREEGRKEGR